MVIPTRELDLIKKCVKRFLIRFFFFIMYGGYRLEREEKGMEKELKRGKKIRLGLSLYPEQEKMEDIERYLGTAAKYGFDKIFTSLFSVKGTKEEVIGYFKNLTQIAHKYGFEVSGDANFVFLKEMGASPEDLSVFQEMGIDTIRMDMAYNDERDVAMINNQQGIRIEMSAAFLDIIENALRQGADRGNMTVCHNFYPQRYTAPSLEAIDAINEQCSSLGLKTAIFISSQEKGTHGPWPISDGLPTIEDHRSLPVQVQLKHCIALKNIDEVLFGNAYASEEEMKALKEVMDQAYIHVEERTDFGAFSNLLPHGDVVRVPLHVCMDENVTDLEREIAFDYPVHCDMGDCLNYVLRSRMTRMIYKKQSIPYRESGKISFTLGDVVIVNDNCAAYRGEIQIVMKEMEADGQRNLIGRVVDEELMLLKHFGANDIFTFVE